jgi:hypothetical protein
MTQPTGAPLPVDLPVPEPSAVPDEPVSRRMRWAVASGAAGICATGFALLYSVNPNLADNPYPRCALKAITGIDCPGCGGTRAMYSLLHGDLAGAADHNILVFLIVPVMLYLLARYVLNLFDVQLPAPRMNRAMAWGLVVALLAFTVLRNTSIAPFAYLGSAAA